MGNKASSIVSISDNSFLYFILILVLLFWNFGDNKYDLYDLLYKWCEKIAN